VIEPTEDELSADTDDATYEIDPQLRIGCVNSSAISSARAHHTAPATHGSRGFMVIGLRQFASV
jgi:hypothetical protein